MSKGFELRILLKKFDIDSLWGRGEHALAVFRNPELSSSCELDQTRFTKIAFRPVNPICKRGLSSGWEKRRSFFIGKGKFSCQSLDYVPNENFACGLSWSPETGQVAKRETRP